MPVAAFGAFTVLPIRVKFRSASVAARVVGVCSGREGARASGRRVGWRPCRWRACRWRATRFWVWCWPDWAGRSAPQGRSGPARRYAGTPTRHRRLQHQISARRRAPRRWVGKRSLRWQCPPGAWWRTYRQCREHRRPHGRRAGRWQPLRECQSSRERWPLNA